MNFLYRAKLYRPLSLMVCVGLVVACQSIAVGAIPAVVAFPQDDDHKKEHNVEVHKIQSDDDENVEVIVIQDGDSGRQDLLKKLKTEHEIDIKKRHSDQGENVKVIVMGDGESGHQDLLKKLEKEHKIDLEKLHAGHGGNIEVVVVQGDEHDGNVEKKLHGHLVELMHGKEAQKADLHELANQLREIADRLDGESHAADEEHELHANVEVLRSGDHGIRILKKAELDKASNQEVEIVVGDGKRFQIRKSDKPQAMIFEVSPEGKAKAPSHDGDHKKMMLRRTKKHDPSPNVIVEKIHVDGKKHSDAMDLHFGKTSDERNTSSLEELRDELEQLREDLRELKASRQGSAGKRVRLKKEGASSKDEGKNRLVWVEEDASDKSDKKILLRELKEQAGKSSPNRFRFEFKKKEASDEANGGNDD